MRTRRYRAGRIRRRVIQSSSKLGERQQHLRPARSYRQGGDRPQRGEAGDDGQSDDRPAQARSAAGRRAVRKDRRRSWEFFSWAGRDRALVDDAERHQLGYSRALKSLCSCRGTGRSFPLLLSTTPDLKYCPTRMSGLPSLRFFHNCQSATRSSFQSSSVRRTLRPGCRRRAPFRH